MQGPAGLLQPDTMTGESQVKRKHNDSQQADPRQLSDPTHASPLVLPYSRFDEVAAAAAGRVERERAARGCRGWPVCGERGRI